MSQPVIDLTRCLREPRHIGDLSLYFTWIFNDAQEADEPALVVIPRYAKRGFKPCVVALSAAYKYNDPRYLAHVAKEFCHLLGLHDDMTTAYNVASLIADHLDDLIKMPPAPTTSIVLADATISIGGKQHNVELLDHQAMKLN